MDAPPDTSLTPAWPQHWISLPVLVAFHEQWWKARGRCVGQSLRPFSRDWETLLSNAGLTNIELRREAERDARLLADAGIIILKSPLRRAKLIQRIQLPLAQELAFAEWFGDPLESANPGFDPGAVPWEPELEFLTRIRSGVAPDDLLAINRFLHEGGRSRPMVPVKERSIHIFGEEKRLDSLASTTLFSEDRLSLAALRAYIVPTPLAWREGPGPQGVILVLENGATWESFASWNLHSKAYSAVIFGAGHRFIDGLASLQKDLPYGVGKIIHIEYFGDLDPEGLRIPHMACGRCSELGLPVPTPLKWAYEQLFEVGTAVENLGASLDIKCMEWLPHALREKAANLFAGRKRIAQEWLGTEQLIVLKNCVRF